MIHFFKKDKTIFAVEVNKTLSDHNLNIIKWVLGNAILINKKEIHGDFIGQKKEMISPWSTNASEIIQNIGIKNIIRIEKFIYPENTENFDDMIQSKYSILDQKIFSVSSIKKKINYVKSIEKYNKNEGLALSLDEINYLKKIEKKSKRKLTDCEIFGFSQINSEHCRHKIFNGQFIIDRKKKKKSLFDLIKLTSKLNNKNIISAYKDNVAFIKGPLISHFCPKSSEKSDIYSIKKIKTVISLKAETHNFPTTVEAFNGAATGAGGEIRDRLSGGRGSLPSAGTAVYFTSYSRLQNNRTWEKKIYPRKWLYQSPREILIKASNGTSDFGNKFGQPLISGSVLTFEHSENNSIFGFDKVVMLAGGIGWAKKNDSIKKIPEKGDKIVLLGGDNYRIGMGGSSVSSLNTGDNNNNIEVNAIQRSNPEMQKRVANVIRGMVEKKENYIVSIHDHGAGGHLNCISELLENNGGVINIDKLPIGDNSLDYKEILGNESQERIGLIIKKKHLNFVKKLAIRERAPLYVIGEVKDNKNLIFKSLKNKISPFELKLEDLFGSSPKSIIVDKTIKTKFSKITYNESKLKKYLKDLLKLESVACKDWLTNKVDRCVSGRVAKQQTIGPINLPLNNCGVMAISYGERNGIATAIGHSPISGLINEQYGSINSIGEALTNIIFAPLKNGISSISLSANWMWPCKNSGEDTRLYNAVKAASDFCISLGINIPTGKDSLSMTQKYENSKVISPGSVIISAVGECIDINNIVCPLLKNKKNTDIIYINLSSDKYKLGGSAFGQIINKVGEESPSIKDSKYFKKIFNCTQKLIKQKFVESGHDISSGGLITSLLEMCFSSNEIGAEINLTKINERDIIKILFAENSSILLQVNNIEKVNEIFKKNNIEYFVIGKVSNKPYLNIENFSKKYSFNIHKYRDYWFETSYLHDCKQSGKIKALERFKNYKMTPLKFNFNKNFTGNYKDLNFHYVKNNSIKIKAGILREKGSNSEREMAYALFIAGFDVKDIHMTDLISGKENLEDLNFLAAVGGFSNSDVLGSAKGWASSFKFNKRAHNSLKNFFKRTDTLSIGICNGCQLFIELDLINPNHKFKSKLITNDSKKFECNFINIDIVKNNSVMFKSLSNNRLGIWSAHGEGKFILPLDESKYNIISKYSYDLYPANPNGSDYSVAGLCSDDGRHNAIMPHPERSIFPWNWATYPNENDKITPWIEPFINARNWIKKKIK